MKEAETDTLAAVRRVPLGAGAMMILDVVGTFLLPWFVAGYFVAW